MDCRSFEEQLDVLVAGILPPREQQAAEEHLSACVRCRRLLNMVRGDGEGVERQADQDLLLSILDRTSGAPCGAAALLLCDWVDGRLDQDDWEIISLHIDHCLNCRSLAASMQELKEVLPEMAEIRTDESFIARVLASTVGHPRESRRDRPRSDFLELCRRMLRRPRFAWEAAYVGALLVLLALGNPVQLPLDAPKMTYVSRLVMQSGGQIMQETATVLANSGKTANNSIRDLRARTHSFVAAAVKYQDLTASNLHGKATLIFEGLKASLFNGNPKQQRDLR
jgi:hypothetical protein